VTCGHLVPDFVVEYEDNARCDWIAVVAGHSCPFSRRADIAACYPSYIKTPGKDMADFIGAPSYPTIENRSILTQNL